MAKEPENGPPSTPRPEAPPATLEEALARAREHGRLAAGRDPDRDSARCSTRPRWPAAAGPRGPIASSPRWRGCSRDWPRTSRRRGGDGPEPLLASIAEALDIEIARWEKRARDDLDARAVLRAFLGLREILWEFGVRPGRRNARSADAPAQALASSASPCRADRASRLG